MITINGYQSSIDKKNVEIKQSTIHGLGLFALKNFYVGQYVCSYSGVLISDLSANAMSDERGAYVMSADYEHPKTHKKIQTNIDSYEPDSCYGRYANDILDVGKYNIDIDGDSFTDVGGNKGALTVFAIKHIKKGDELYLDYDISYWKSKSRVAHLPETTIERMKQQHPDFNEWYVTHTCATQRSQSKRYSKEYTDDDAETVTDDEYAKDDYEGLEQFYVQQGTEINFEGIEEIHDRWEHMDPSADIAVVLVNRNNPEQIIDIVRSREVIDLTMDDVEEVSKKKKKVNISER